MSVLTGVGFDPLKDVRHLAARAAPDLADWLAHLDLEGKADRTLYEYLRTIARLLRAFPEHELTDYTTSDIEHVLRTIPPRSRHIPRSIFNSFFAWALLNERIPKNPVDRAARIKEPRRRPKDIFTPEEVAILEGLPSPDGPLFALLFGSGLRQGEARNLRREHVDLNRARLIVYHGKGDKDRIVPLLHSAVVAVSDLDLLERLDRGDYLWYSKPGGGRRMSRVLPIGSSTFDSWFRRCIKTAGVPYRVPHTTRHSYGDIVRQMGLDIEERQILMGHESIRTTQKYYGTLTVEDVARKIARLEAELADRS